MRALLVVTLVLATSWSCVPQPPAGSVGIDVSKRLFFIKDANTQECIGVSLVERCDSCNLDAWVVPAAYCEGHRLPMIEPEQRK